MHLFACKILLPWFLYYSYQQGTHCKFHSLSQYHRASHIISLMSSANSQMAQTWGSWLGAVVLVVTHTLTETVHTFVNWTTLRANRHPAHTTKPDFTDPQTVSELADRSSQSWGLPLIATLLWDYLHIWRCVLIFDSPVVPWYHQFPVGSA